jgi:hypothetical protein
MKYTHLPLLIFLYKIVFFKIEYFWGKKFSTFFTNNIIISVEATKVLGIHTQIKRNTLSNLLQKLASKNTK